MSNTPEVKPAQSRLRIGLTGGIASGKSLVADLFAARGIDIIDTDVIAREVVAPGQPALDEIAREFGANVISSDGSLDRRALRRLVFNNENKRQTLEALLHPLIRASATAKAADSCSAYHIVVVPLLVESPMQSDMDRILVVDCPTEVQLERLLERDQESAQQARKMIAAQASREARLAIADDVINNGGDLDATEQQVDQLHMHYLELAETS